jgi:hypothetical protein
MKLFKTIETSFEKYDETIRRYLSKTFNNLGMEYTHTQIFGVIFDGLKGVMQNIMFYIEDAFTEQNIFKARRKDSIYSLAKISGYEAFYGSAAVGTIIGQMQINNGLSTKTTKVYLKNHMQILNRTNGVTYSLQLPTNYYVFDISKPLMSHEFKIIQGTYARSRYVAKGVYLETLSINNVGLFDRQYIEVYVNGEKWQEVSNLYDMTEGGHEYVVTIGYDNAIDIMFGNNIYGTMLLEGDTVDIDYLIHSGTLGNIMPNSTTDFVFKEYATDSLGNRVNANDYMKLYMQNCISGGTDSDSIKFIRSMVGANSRSLVLVSEDNFKLFFKRFSFIGYTACWSESNSMFINATCLSNIKEKIKEVEDYFKLDEKDMLLTNEQKEMILNTLDKSQKTFAGITLKFQDPVIRKYAFICYVKVDSNYNKETTTALIRQSLGEFFLNISNDTIFIAKSDLIRRLSYIESIQAIDIDIISDYAEQAYKDGIYTKYELNYVNNSYKYVEVNKIYNPNEQPGLDGFGNIKLNAKLEIPILHGGFNYYPNKDSKDQTSSIKIDDIQVYFI